MMTSRMTPEQTSNGFITPAQLEHMALDYVLRKHCEKIKTISLAFRQVDTDEDGIISHQQLYVMVEKLNIKAEIDADELTDLLDPFKTNSITFSHLI